MTSLFRLAMCFLALVSACAPFGAGASPATGSADERFEAAWSAFETHDYVRARELWEPLARDGRVAAQINLAVLWEQGLGGERALERAADWYRRAARQGEAVAQLDLALLLRDAPELTEDGESIVGWLALAAGSGHPRAELELGLLQWESARAPADSVEALAWIRLAGEHSLESSDLLTAGRTVTALREWAPRDAYLAALEEALEVARPGWGRSPEPGAPAPGSRELGLSEDAVPDGFPLDGHLPRSFGTAWPVAGGYVVTNHHIVSEKTEIVLVMEDGTELPARVVVLDAESDLAVLGVVEPSRLPRALPLATGEAGLGADVFTLGFPRVDVMGRSPKLTHGIISGTTGPRDDPRSYLVSVPIQAGNSGGPLLNMRGEVVGVVTSMLGITDASGETRTLPNVGYALKSSHLEALLGLVPDAEEAFRELPAGTASLERLAERIRRSVLMVVAR